MNNKKRIISVFCEKDKYISFLLTYFCCNIICCYKRKSKNYNKHISIQSLSYKETLSESICFEANQTAV